MKLLSPTFCRLAGGALALLLAAPAARATTYYVSPTGSDAANGLTAATAWRTLAYACDQVPAGAHTIRLAAGTYPETRPSTPRSGVSLVGAGPSGTGATVLTNAASFVASHSVCGPSYFSWGAPEDYLIQIWNKRAVTVRDLQLRSAGATQLLNGGIYVRDAHRVELDNLAVKDFRWAGVHAIGSDSLNFHHSRFENASQANDCGQWSAGLRSAYIARSELHHLTIVSTVSGPYGYKASGHENVKIHDNDFDVNGEFAIESAFENEYGAEIYRNRFNRCLSLPKPGQGADPNTRGFTYSFWVHDNYMTDSYGIEGPRNHLRVSHNFFDVQRAGGRIYTQHGGNTTGPIWIDHNVVRNASFGFVYARGQLENLHLDNNTVLFSPGGGWVIDVWDGTGMRGWTVSNNVFVGNPDPNATVPASQLNTGLNTYATADPAKFAYDHNLVINCSNTAVLPAGTNWLNQAPGLRLSGAWPAPYYLPGANAQAGDYYRPASATSFVVDRGVNVGLPFLGTAPDLGAYEWGSSGGLAARPAAEAAALAVYPNPSAGEATVLGLDADLVRVAVADAAGRTCAALRPRLRGRQACLDLRGLAPGLYVVEAEDAAGAVRRTKLHVE